MVDTQGTVLRVSVHPADVTDCRGAPLVFQKLSRTHFDRLNYFWADRAYRGWLVRWVLLNLKATLHIVARPDGAPIWMKLPRRWVIERTFAWLGRYRRLSKDYEQLPVVSEAFVYIASIRRLVCLYTR